MTTPEDTGKQPAPTTPGRPAEDASRQQKSKDQASQTGNDSLDRQSSDADAPKKAPTPPGPK